MRTRKKRPASPGASLTISEAKSGFLQVGIRLFATLRYYVVGDALTFVKGAHSRAFNRTLRSSTGILVVKMAVACAVAAFLMLPPTT